MPARANVLFAAKLGGAMQIRAMPKDRIKVRRRIVRPRLQGGHDVQMGTVIPTHFFGCRDGDHKNADFQSQGMRLRARQRGTRDGTTTPIYLRVAHDVRGQSLFQSLPPAGAKTRLAKPRLPPVVRFFVNPRSSKAPENVSRLPGEACRSSHHCFHDAKSGLVSVKAYGPPSVVPSSSHCRTMS